MEIDISAIICTHNGARHLGKAIGSLANQSMPKERYEIVIVDNCSTDSTKEVIDNFANVENIRYIHESTLGLSFARNAGWHNARGKYVAYLDDDAIASSVWLDKILGAFESIKPRPGCIGGRVDPIWEAPRPPWVSDDLLTCLTVINWSDTPQLLPDLNQKWLVGANIAFPVEVLEEIGGFVAGLDRVGKNLLSGGDVFLQKQILKAGYTCYYHPEIAVHHLTPKSRLNQRWFINRYYWQGLSDAAAQLIQETPTPAERLRFAFPKIMQLLRSPGTLANLMSARENPKQFTEKCFALITLGHIAGLLGGLKSRGGA
jgi:glycosyltransferase involved in cell wall biosynthesis